eukprot:TRINITY_DN8098_c0_g1_i1.p2 TRINITY_DN8098_c0_g1~~TRINITY_DN8098_c0_g1_i1.p2  ORF type:complete len:145 (-),score=54.41 TRINITY_DN8098_c0_g1_i1:262-696(-)
MNVEEDEDLLWIAREGLTASLPEPWESIENAEGELYFHNKETNEATYVHPMDEEYKALYRQEKERMGKGLGHELSDEGKLVCESVLGYSEEEVEPENLEYLINVEKEILDEEHEKRMRELDENTEAKEIEELKKCLKEEPEIWA